MGEFYGHKLHIADYIKQIFNMELSGFKICPLQVLDLT